MGQWTMTASSNSSTLLESASRAFVREGQAIAQERLGPQGTPHDLVRRCHDGERVTTNQ